MKKMAILLTFLRQQNGQNSIYLSDHPASVGVHHDRDRLWYIGPWGFFPVEWRSRRPGACPRAGVGISENRRQWRNEARRSQPLITADNWCMMALAVRFITVLLRTWPAVLPRFPSSDATFNRGQIIPTHHNAYRGQSRVSVNVVVYYRDKSW